MNRRVLVWCVITRQKPLWFSFSGAWVCYWFVTEMAYTLWTSQLIHFFVVVVLICGVEQLHFKGLLPFRLCGVVVANVPCCQLKSKWTEYASEKTLQWTTGVFKLSHVVSSCMTLHSAHLLRPWPYSPFFHLCFVFLSSASFSLCIDPSIFSLLLSHTHSYSISMCGNPAICPPHPPSPCLLLANLQVNYRNAGDQCSLSIT